MFLLKIIFILLSTFIFISLIIKYSKILGLVDIPNDRSIHFKNTPRGAGIGFILSFFLTFIIFNFDLLYEKWGIFLGIFLVYFIGILDDHKDASPKVKFYFIFFSTMALFVSDVYIDSLGIYFGYNLELSLFIFPFTFLVIAGVTNALNLIDGIDGLAASISMTILVFFIYIGYSFYNDLIFNIALVTFISLISFLYFNWTPAKIFMGDSGSLTLGFIIIVLAILSLEYIHPVSLLYIVAIPIIDTLVVFTRRIRNKKSPFKADKTHIHHILLNFFGDVKRTVLFLVLIQFMFSLFGYISARHISQFPDEPLPFVLLIGFFIILVLSYMILTFMKKKQNIIKKLKKKR